MSPLETYRKQAKQLVRWHREGHYSIGGRIRGLARYRHLTDAQALKMKFPLATAQEIIACEAGFESWAELKSRSAAAAQGALRRSHLHRLRPGRQPDPLLPRVSQLKKARA